MTLAQFILDNLEPLLDDWEQFARSLDRSRAMSVGDLRDHAEAMLHDIALDMQTAQSRTEQREKSEGLASRSGHETNAEQHASGRFQSGFDVRDMVSEYRALRATVIRHWLAAEGARSEASLDELTRFNEAIDQAVAESVARFAAHVERAEAADRERRAAEAEIVRASEERLQTAITAADLGTWELDLTSDRSPQRSLRHDRMFGYAEPQREWGQQIAERHVVPEDVPLFRAAFERAREQGELDCECRVRWPDGSVHWIAARGRTQYDASGRPVRMAGVVADVTARRMAEAAMRESEERFRIMADGLPHMVWVHDAMGRQEMVNATFCEFFGVTREAIDEGRWRALLHPDDAPAYIAAYEQANRQQRPFHEEARVRRRDGEWRWIESWGRPRTSPDGTFLGFVGASLDVTERKQADDALREADRKKDRFLALLAHELRNPLAPIRHAAAILLRVDAGDPTVRWCGAVIDRQVGQMAHLLDDLLDVSRITFGKLKVDLERCDAVRVIEQAVETARPAIEKRRDRLTTETAGAPLHVRADPVRLAQVLANLLNNAAKYSPPETEIRITAQRAGDEVAISVIDHGVGIDATDLQKVFQMFAQVESASAPARDGLGLGLALAKGLIELQGGRIEAESAGRGQGSRFTVRLPALDAGGAESQPAARPAGGMRARRVLVVDDLRDSADSLAMLLRQGGHEVQVAYDGEEALACAATFQPEAAFIDIGMPRMDGHALARRLRGTEWGRGAMLVAVTGWGGEDDRDRTREAGFDAHLTKPVAGEALNGMLARLGA